MVALFRLFPRAVSPFNEISAGGGVSPRWSSPPDAGPGEFGDIKTGSDTGMVRSLLIVVVIGGAISGTGTGIILVAVSILALDFVRSLVGFGFTSPAFAAATSSMAIGLGFFLGELISSLVLFTPSGLRALTLMGCFSRASFLMCVSSFNVLPPAFSLMDTLSAAAIRGAAFSFVICRGPAFSDSS